MSETDDRRKTTSKGVRYTDDELELAGALLRYTRYGSLAELLHEASIKGLLMLATQLPDEVELPDFQGRQLRGQLPALAWQELLPVFDYLARHGVLPRSSSGSASHVLSAAPGAVAPAPQHHAEESNPESHQRPGALEVDQDAHDYLDTMGSTLLD